MRKYELIIFDLDGTLADTSPGIINAHRHTASQMRIHLHKNALEGIIGGELLNTYRTRFGLSDGDARKAVDIYRKWYAEEGIHQAVPYEGMGELLRELKALNRKVAVATLKREDFAKTLLQELGLANYFDFIFGMDAADTLNKRLLIEKCMAAAKMKPDQTVLVGDSSNDLLGAAEAKVDFVGVTYGFGFSASEKKYEYYAHSPKEILESISRLEA